MTIARRLVFHYDSFADEHDGHGFYMFFICWGLRLTYCRSVGFSCLNLYIDLALEKNRARLRFLSRRNHNHIYYEFNCGWQTLNG